MPYKDPIDRYWVKRKTRLKSAPRYDRTGHTIQWLLSREEVRILLDEAGITIEQVGTKMDDYQLSRFDDLGDYAYGNCEFKLRAANWSEHWNRVSGYGMQLELPL